MKLRSAAAGGVICALAFSIASAASYPAMAPLARYFEATEADEIALARSAAPSSISAEADVLTLGKDGYKPTIKGTNGFVCLVERSWATAFSDPEFWNTKFRAPTCYNRAAARSVLPHYLERTGWVLAGVPKSELLARTRAELSAHTFTLPETGAMAYMMSKQTHLHDADGHWHPHLMFYLANTEAAAWGANLEGSPVLADGSTIFAQEGVPEPLTIFFVPLKTWSDSTPGE
jgi:hypothetical protein